MRQKGAPLPALTSLQIQGDAGPYTFYTRTGGQVVFYPFAPPDKPPSPSQIVQRRRLALVAEDWQALDNAEKQKWNAMAKRGRTWMTGYNLYSYAALTPNSRDHMDGLRRQSQLPSIPLFTPR